MRLTRWTSMVALAAAACSPGAGPGPVANRAGGGGAWAPTLPVSPGDRLGWLGLAPAAGGDDEQRYWIPVADDAAVLVPAPAPGLEPGTRVLAVPARGPARVVTAGAPTQVRYGCDGGPLDVIPLVGERLAAGPTWLVPLDAPAAWQPAALAIEPGVAARDRRAWRIGPIAIELHRIDRARATLVIGAGPRRLAERPVETYYMDGAPPVALDVSGDLPPGVPSPVAAFEVAPGEPVLVVLLTSGYEGVGLQTMIVDGERAVRAESMEAGLYYCAF